MTTYYDDMSESAALNYLAGTTDFGDAAAIRLIAAYIDAATGDGSPEGAVTGGVGDLYTDSTNGHLYIKASGTGNTGWVQLESATSGSGDVNGPGSATDNALVRFDGTGGKTVQSSGITVDDSGNVTSDLSVSKASALLKVTGTGGTHPVVRITGDAGTNRSVFFYTGPNDRWCFRADNTAESGSDAGSNFVILNTLDSGAGGGTPFKITRATGKTTLGSVGASAGLELGSSGPRVMSGTGSPEGVVTAPVGSTWIDTAATTGAIKWVKASGTGNTGWVVEYGDTGIRDIAASIANSWTVSPHLHLRRTGNIVTLYVRQLDGAAASDTTFVTLPTGFRPAYDFLQFPVSLTGSAFGGYGAVYSTGEVAVFGTSSACTGGRLEVIFATSNAWPTSLPGSAA